MGRKSMSVPQQAYAWLPGFEPESFENTNSVLNDLTHLTPPAQPREVAVIAGIVASQTLAQNESQLKQTTKDALEVVDSDELPISTVVASNDPVVQVGEEVEVEPPREWPVFDANCYSPAKGDTERLKANLRAIELVQKLKATGQQPTQEQRFELLGYVGWGGLAKVFEDLGTNNLTQYQGQLKSLLSEEEFVSARASVTSAYYTGPRVIKALWDIVQRLGFKGGRIIEPAAGTGLFLAGMPVEIAQKSEITAVELDKISGAILTSTFGGLGVTTHISGIEKANVPNSFYDLAISNVPFGDHKTLETRPVGFREWNIHNYFFGKAVDLVRPGGLIVFVTSKHTLDSQTNAHRKWLNAHAEMLGAIRLPEGAFKKQANTEVVTDIVVMRKRAVPMFNEAAAWLQIGEAPLSSMLPGISLTGYLHGHSYTYPRKINGWFQKNPHMICGVLDFVATQYSKELVPVFGGDAVDFSNKLDSCVLALPEGIYKDVEKIKCDSEHTSFLMRRVNPTSQVKPGAYVMHQGSICISEGASWIEVDKAFKGMTRERMIGMIGLKEVTRKLLKSQTDSSDDVDFKRTQAELNSKYDAFVAAYGNIADRANTRVFRTDPDCPLLLSLERYDEDTERFVKADIFSRRTVGNREVPEKAENVKDAMLISLAVYGRMVITDMARRMSTSNNAVEKLLREDALAYVDPQDGGQWKPADEYLSGHIREKIAAAKAAGKRYLGNIEALTAVLPADLGPGEVEARLGAPWIPASCIEQFVCELIEIDKERFALSYDSISATWSVQGGTKQSKWLGNCILNHTTWGTADRTAVELVEAALNQTPPRITRTVNDRTVVDRNATLAAREKYEAIKAEFRKWVYKDGARRDMLLRIYNDEFNQTVDRNYDGSHLVLQGASSVIVPYRSQLNAIWRIMSGGNTLLAHSVGAGKTFIMAAAAMELRRIGKARKVCITCPNNLLEQFTGDFVRFYPEAKVLMATKEDFTGDKRREFSARVATGDWDAVVMTHSTFERLPLRPETQKRFIDDLLEQARLAVSIAQESGAKRSIKQTEKLLKALEAKVERALKANTKDDFVYFDDLGIDYLMVDEAHLFKNLMRVSKMPQIAGLPNVSSNRAFDLWSKTAVIMEMKGGKEEGLTMATATPIANSVAELHVMMKYLMPQTLRKLGLYEFDAWASTFGEAVQGMEVAPDGSGYRLNTRFCKFVNVPELMSLFRQVADIQTHSMLNLPTPAIKGGKPWTVKAVGSAELIEYTKGLVERADKIRNGSVSPNEDNMLSITNSGRKAALDMRLIDPTLPFDTTGKVAKAVENITRIWRDGADQRVTQLVFCDLSTPKANGGFSVYTDLKARLISNGIPAEQIAFIQDYDSDALKAKLFRLVRAGTVRVLLGSTIMMGMGTNVQKRLKAIHQLDSPWRPADVQQRDGRGLRAGNECDEIELLRYVTEGSFDAYIWSLLEVKMRFIEQIMTAKSGVRTVEDLSMGALTYAEIKAIATGNPLVLEKATIDAEVMKYSVLRDLWEQERWSLERRGAHNNTLIQSVAATMKAVEQDAQAIEQESESGWLFKPRATLCQKALEANDVETKLGAQLWAVSREVQRIGEVIVGSVAGMDIVLTRYEGINLSLQSRNGAGSYKIGREGIILSDAYATGQRVLERLQSLTEEPQDRRSLLEKMAAENSDISKFLDADYEQQEKLDALIARQREIESELDLDKDEAGIAEVSEKTTKDEELETT
jgi:N12 class adenine-specific DNA methylase